MKTVSKTYVFFCETCAYYIHYIAVHLFVLLISRKEPINKLSIRRQTIFLNRLMIKNDQQATNSCILYVQIDTSSIKLRLKQSQYL